MRIAKQKNRSRLVAAAMGKIPCDLTIENVQLVNVVTGEVYPASVDVLDGMIVRVREKGETNDRKSKTIYEGNGAYLIPGFIDTHMHVESTMMIPEQFARAVLPWGTTTVVTDPHEIGNVMGIEGVKFMLENAKNTPLRQYVLAPSCVPSVPALEGGGAAFHAEEIADLLDTPGVIGIAEVMDYVNVIKDEKRMHDILAEGLKRDVFVQGHAPGVMGKEMQAYTTAGPISDHECRYPEECRQKLRAGMHVNMKSSSLSDFLKESLQGIKGMRYTDFVSFCTDDVHAKDILETGHMNRVVRKAIRLGTDPIDAIRFATLNAAREYSFSDLGAICPGYIADMQLVKDLDGEKPIAVFAQGQLTAEHGKYIPREWEEKKPHSFPNTMHMDHITSPEDFALHAPDGKKGSVRTNVIVSKYKGGAFNKAVWEELPIQDGKVDIRRDPNLAFAAVCNRHGSGDRTVVVVRDFGLVHGAIASTISHDSHNFCVVYKNPEDAYAAAKELCRTGGGITVVSDGSVLATAALPVAGLMSPLPVEQLAVVVDQAIQAICKVSGGKNVFPKITSLALVVLPGTLLSDKGLVDGPSQTFLPIFDEPDNKTDRVSRNVSDNRNN